MRPNEVNVEAVSMVNFQLSRRIKTIEKLTVSFSLQGGDVVQFARASREDESHRVYNSSSKWFGVHKHVAFSLFMLPKKL